MSVTNAARFEPLNGHAAGCLECGDLSPLSFSNPVGGGEKARKPERFEIQSDDESSQSKDGDEASVDRKTAEAILARMWTQAAEAVQQELAEKRVMANEEASTRPSRETSRDGSMDHSGEHRTPNKEPSNFEGKTGRQGSAV